MFRIGASVILVGLMSGCARPRGQSIASAPVPINPLDRTGHEIMIAGELFDIGTPVILWNDPGGFNAYSKNEKAGVTALEPSDQDRPFGVRSETGTGLEQIDQFVIHYDQAGTSRRCFEILHEVRGLSAHFLLDLDGTIYQTLDVQERAWHATKANSRSIGIEIANIGAYPPKDSKVLDRWYTNDQFDRAIRLPSVESNTVDEASVDDAFVARPARPEAVVGQIQGQWLKMYDLTNEQYDALIHLTATLCSVFPAMACDYPRHPDGSLVTTVLPDDVFDRFGGLLGHFHVQANKVDPGPAFDWDRVVQGARSLQGERRARVSTRHGRLTTTGGRGGGSSHANEHSGE